MTPFLRDLESLEPRYETSFVSLGYLVQEMYATVLSLVSRVLELKRLGAFSKEPRYRQISPSVEALRRQTEDLMELLQFPDAASQRREHILQGFRKLQESPSPLFFELQRAQLENLLEDTERFRMQCVHTAERMKEQVFHVHRCLEKKVSPQVLELSPDLSPENSGYVSLQEVLIPLGEEVLKMGSLGSLFREEGVFLERLEEEYRHLLRRMGDRIREIQERASSQGSSESLPEEETVKMLEIFQAYSTREERQIFREFFASRGDIPEYAAFTEETEEDDLSGVDLF